MATDKTTDNLRTIMRVLIVVAAALAIAFVVVLVKDTKLVKDLNSEKADLTERIMELQKDYSTLTSDYAEVNSQLDSSREEVAQLIEHIKTTEATNRSKMRQYERELGTLRSIMRSYIVQIDSLNNANQKLTAEVAKARKEAGESRRQNQQLKEQVESLTSRVVAGSALKARGITMIAENSSDRQTDRSSRVVRLAVTLTLLENDIAQTGNTDIFIRVFDPEGNLLLDGSDALFALDGEEAQATASRQVDYEGSELDMTIYVNNIPSYHKGLYTAEVFSEQGRLGGTELLLR